MIKDMIDTIPELEKLAKHHVTLEVLSIVAAILFVTDLYILVVIYG